MNTKLPLYLALLLLTQCSKCKTDDPAPVAPNPVDALPPATQTGQRTFGCLLNGQPWNLAGNPFGGPLLTSEYYNGRLIIVARGATSVNGVVKGGIIEIDIDDIVSAGNYTISVNDSTFVNYQSFTPNCQYYTGPLHPAVVEITRLDLVNRIVAGRFSFALDASGCGRVVVTEGRFDSRF